MILIPAGWTIMWLSNKNHYQPFMTKLFLPLLTTALLTHEVGGFVIDAIEEDPSFPTSQLMEWDLSFLHFILQRL